MREEPVLTAAPRPIASLPEFYAIAFHQARLAAHRYGATRTGKDSQALRPIFEMLAARENARADAISAACTEACGQPPDLKNLPATFMDLVPAQEVADITQSSLSTPYAAWALAVRHRQRAFIYWTYVAALARHPTISAAAEALAREALADGNQLRRQRRLAWRNEEKPITEDDEETSAALLESLLRRDIVAWSQTLPPPERKQLLRIGTLTLLPETVGPLEDIQAPLPDEIKHVKQRALRRAEQLSNIYLDEADKATNQNSLELAQKLASCAIARLAGLRSAASSSFEMPTQ